MSRTVDYRYAECGLDNVILKGLRVVVDDTDEEVVQIPNINGLHQLLVRMVASKDSALQPKEIRFLRTELGLTQAALAAVVGRDVQAVGRWERGEHPVDQSVEMVIRRLALEHAHADVDLTTEELARRTVVTAHQPQLLVDARDPANYVPMDMAAAA